MTDFIIDNSDHLSVSGTSYKKVIWATLPEMIEVFGQPDTTPGDKITCQWIIKFPREDGTTSVATIYDYKSPVSPLDDFTYGRHPWHIGAHDGTGAADLLEQVFNDF